MAVTELPVFDSLSVDPFPVRSPSPDGVELLCGLNSAKTVAPADTDDPVTVVVQS